MRKLSNGQVHRLHCTSFTKQVLPFGRFQIPQEFMCSRLQVVPNPVSFPFHDNPVKPNPAEGHDGPKSKERHPKLECWWEAGLTHANVQHEHDSWANTHNDEAQKIVKLVHEQHVAQPHGIINFLHLSPALQIRYWDFPAIAKGCGNGNDRTVHLKTAIPSYLISSQ